VAFVAVAFVAVAFVAAAFVVACFDVTEELPAELAVALGPPAFVVEVAWPPLAFWLFEGSLAVLASADGFWVLTSLVQGWMEQLETLPAVGW